MAVPDTDSLLVITGFGMPRYSARGLTQTLTVINQSQMLKRTINGALHNLALEQFKKYSSTISCTDQRIPAIDGIFPGQEVTVECTVELPVNGSPARPVVEGSERTEGDDSFYRPVLTMMVMNYTVSFDEYGAAYQWTLELEES